MKNIALVGNIIKVATRGEAEFVDHFEDVYHAALKTQFPVIIIDLSDATGLGDDAFRMIALTHISCAEKRKGKHFRAKIPPSLARAFKNAGLYKQIDVFVVKETPLLEAPESQSSAAIASFPEERRDDAPAMKIEALPDFVEAPPSVVREAPDWAETDESRQAPPAEREQIEAARPTVAAASAQAAISEGEDSGEWVPPSSRSEIREHEDAQATDTQELLALVRDEGKTPRVERRSPTASAPKPQEPETDTQELLALVRKGGRDPRPPPKRAPGEDTGFEWTPGREGEAEGKPVDTAGDSDEEDAPDEFAEREDDEAPAEPVHEDAGAPDHHRSLLTGRLVEEQPLGSARFLLRPIGAGAPIVLEKAEFVIGRKDYCDLVIDTPYISKKHARIVREGDEYFLEDLGSSNGTLIDGHLIIGRVALHEGQELALARTKDHPQGLKRFKVVLASMVKA